MAYKDLTQTSPDPTLKALAFKGENGQGGLAKLAHVNTVTDILNGILALDAADDAAALALGVGIGELYHNSGAVRVRLT